MSVIHEAIEALLKKFRHNCKKLRSNETEMKMLEDGYFRYRDLLQEQARLRENVRDIFGVLGVYAPAVSAEMAHFISPNPINSTDVRSELQLKLWEVLELFLGAIDQKATISEFKKFLFYLDWPAQVTSQAVDSAVKAHPELFKEKLEDREKFLALA